MHRHLQSIVDGSSKASVVALLAVLGAREVSAQFQVHQFLGTEDFDLFGYSVARLGDVDGDGIGDLVVGASRDDNIAGADCGSARVISGINGATLYTVHGDAAGWRLGWSVSSAGDVNGDGWDDLVAGAPNAAILGPETGIARVYSGPDGAVLFTFPGAATLERLGSDVVGAGDLNGDGRADVAVGSPYADLGALNAGRFQVFSGADGSVLLVVVGSEPDGRLGANLDPCGDLNGDGITDLLVGSPTSDVGGVDSGRVLVFSGAGGAVLLDLPGDAPGDWFGYSVAGRGDVDGDLIGDLVVGARLADANGIDSGLARAYSGADGSALWTVEGSGPGENFGFAVAGGGRLDPDPVPDVIVGAPAGALFGPSAGYSRAFAGDDGDLLFTFAGGSAGDQSGFAVSRVADLTGDGLEELILSSILDDTSGSTLGSVTVWSLSCTAPPPASYCIGAPNSAGPGATMGWSGSTSVSGDDFTLTAAGGIPGSYGMFFYGPATMQLPLGDGFLCVDGGTIGIFRLEPGSQISAGGTLFRKVDFDAPPSVSGAGRILGGATWYFQLWYRDSPAGMSGYNLSNGLAVTFCP